MENYIGRLLDNRYEILEVIGTGGMAVVYKARCHRLNRIVAIKILKDDLSQDAEFRRRFHAESQAVAMMSHPNIINVYDVSHSDNVDYIVMELIDGITLKQYMEQKGALNWREVLHFATQIAKALEHAHGRGIIHRDIKPHNIIILKDGSVKVADFGIARVSSAQSTLTREALGSVHYISPEQAKGGKIDYRSDLYSLGVVMYEMLTGRPPFDGETPVSVAIQHINAQAAMPRTIQPQIPLGIEQITMRAMTADLDERYESASQMLWELDEFRKNPNINLAAAEPAVQEVREVQVTAADRAVHGKAAVRQKKAQAKGKRNGSTGLVAGIICIVLAVVGIGYFLYSFFLADIFSGIEEIEVPNFVGQYAENINQAAYPQFNIFIGEWLPSETVESGYVISQSPKAERMAKVGASISLTVSSGSITDAMRDLVNQTVQNASTILDNLLLDIQVEILYESSDLINEDCVIRTIPAAGEPLQAGQVVTLIVSTGPEIKLTPVPGLLGLKESRAIEKLTEANLEYDVTYVDSDEPVNTVIFQSIQQDEMVKEGTTINLQISNGPENETPDDPLDNETTGFPGMPVTRIINIPLPTMDDIMMVSVFMDGVRQDEFEVDPATVSNNQIPIALDGAGVHQIDVLIDGALWRAISFDFDTGEFLS